MSLRNKTIAEALREGKQRLRSAGKDAYAVEAELLLEKAVGLNRTALFLRGEEPLSAEAAMQYEGFLAERESGRPTQYILGTWESYRCIPSSACAILSDWQSRRGR